MTKVKSLEDLRRLKEEAHHTIQLREAQGTKIVIGLGTCGIAAGAREVMRAVLDEVERQGADAHVTTVGCKGMCAQEPLVEILQPSGGRITYGKVTPEMVATIVSEHVIHGHPVDKWVVARASSI